MSVNSATFIYTRALFDLKAKSKLNPKTFFTPAFSRYLFGSFTLKVTAFALLLRVSFLSCFTTRITTTSTMVTLRQVLYTLCICNSSRLSFPDAQAVTMVSFPSPFFFHRHRILPSMLIKRKSWMSSSACFFVKREKEIWRWRWE